MFWFLADLVGDKGGGQVGGQGQASSPKNRSPSSWSAS